MWCTHICTKNLFIYIYASWHSLLTQDWYCSQSVLSTHSTSVHWPSSQRVPGYNRDIFFLSQNFILIEEQWCYRCFLFWDINTFLVHFSLKLKLCWSPKKTRSIYNIVALTLVHNTKMSFEISCLMLLSNHCKKIEIFIKS